MEIDKNNVIRRFHDIIYAPDVPALYGQGLNDYEILVRLAKVVNTNADTMTNWLTIEKELEGLLENANEIIKENVISVIGEMYKNGDFDEIFNEIMRDYINSNLPLDIDLSFKREYRKLWSIGDNYVYQTITVRPSVLQSGTYVQNYGGNDYYCYCVIPEGINSLGHNNSGAIILVNTSTGEIAGQAAVTMGHMNSCDYNPEDNCFYIAGCFNYPTNDSTEHTNSGLIYIIEIDEILNKNTPSQNSDYNDLSHLSDVNAYHPTYRTIDLNTILTNLPNTGNIASNNISYDTGLNAGVIYAGTGRARIYKIDTVNETVIEQMYTENLETELANLQQKSNFTMQSTSIHNGYMYTVTYNPSMIIRSNLTTQKIDYIYNLPQILDNGYFVMGEPEAVKILDNGDIYLFSSMNLFQTSYRQRRMSQIFKSNIYNNYYHSKTAVSLVKKEPLEIFVDRFYATDSHNPTGTSDNPFRGIDEAIAFCNNNEIADAMTVSMRTSSVWVVEVTTSKKVKIIKSNNATDLGSHDKMSIGGLLCSGANVIIEDLDVHMSLPTESVKGSAYIYCYDSNLTARRIFITRNNTDLSNAYNFNSSFGNLDGRGEFTVESGKQTSSNGIAWAGTNFISDSASFINAHGWASLTTGVIA